MVSAERLGVFLKLQQIVLDNEDSNNLLTNLLPQIFQSLISINLIYEFIAVIFIDENHQPLKSYCTNSTNNLINLENLLAKGSAWEKESLWGEIVISSEINQFIQNSYPNFTNIKSIIISPIHIGKKLSGLLVLVNPREGKEVVQEEQEIIKLTANILGLAYKIQDTQTSLTNVTQEVYKMNLKLHQLDKLKDDFVSVASHELRTPMTAIRSYAWMALNRPDVILTDKMKKYLERTLISTERLINLVNDMLNVSRIEAGSIEIRPKSFDIRALTNEVMIEVGTKASEKSLHLEVEQGSTLDIFADQDKVHQILLNLIGNALKFTPNEGKISINLFPDGKMVDISVTDSGVGIAEDDQSRLFKKFERLDNSYVSSATSGGTGLGLFISKSLVELMGGKIWASSQGSGKGSTFTFSLPLATTEVLSQAEKYTKKPEGDIKILEPVAI
ncbi:MAG: GAF domain-containing sensor histidine kinase [Candidatus Daviesbacteria bacterium]|nr:GAF domain-containing sensor histidine kinase [Candidatus Daviesbacteria bacterium]